MPRPSKAEIDAKILDGAAALFARHGFARTSLQQIAEALGYTNAGLLHHYASKKALYEAAVSRYAQEAATRLDVVMTVPPGLERDRAFVAGCVTMAFDWPGMSALSDRLALEGAEIDPEFAKMGGKLFDAMGIDRASPDPERVLRVFNAVSGISQAVRIARAQGHGEEMRALIARVAMDTLGHYGEGADQPPARG